MFFPPSLAPLVKLKKKKRLFNLVQPLGPLPDPIAVISQSLFPSNPKCLNGDKTFTPTHFTRLVGLMSSCLQNTLSFKKSQEPKNYKVLLRLQETLNPLNELPPLRGKLLWILLFPRKPWIVDHPYFLRVRVMSLFPLPPFPGLSPLINPWAAGILICIWNPYNVWNPNSTRAL